MVDKGPLLTSAVIFYLSIGAAIFQVLEEPNWKQAVNRYRARKDKILEDYPCLSQDDLDRILEVWTTHTHTHTLFSVALLLRGGEGEGGALMKLSWSFGPFHQTLTVC